jgi:hypothetical protein
MSMDLDLDRIEKEATYWRGRGYLFAGETLAIIKEVRKLQFALKPYAERATDGGVGARLALGMDP